MGGYFGGRLAQAGEDVTFIARGNHLKALQTKGLRLDSIKGNVVLPMVKVIDDPAKVGAVDVVLLGVKTWQKFLFVVSWGGVGAVTQAPIGVIRSVPQTRRLLEQSMREILDVAQAFQIRLPEGIVSKTLDFMDTLPPNGTTSMQRDIAEGRPSEIDAWNGAVVRLGGEAGVAVSLHEFIYSSLLPLEKKARGELQFPK